MISTVDDTLREGWKVEELEKLIDLIQNGISSKQNNERIGYPVSRIETIQNSTFDKNRIKYVDADIDAFNKYKYDIGDISFSHINSYEIIGKVAIYRGDIDNLLHGVNLLRLKFNDKIYSEYGYYFFKSSLARKEYEPHIKRAINQASINQKNLKSILVPFPPLEEQQRIVAKIDGLFAKIDKAISLTEESLVHAKNLLPSVLKEVFERGKADGWEEKEFGEVITTLTDYHANGSYKVLKKNVDLKDVEDYAWMIRSTDFEKDFKNSLKYIDKHAYDFMSKSQVYGNEIIMSKIGNAGIVYLMPSIDRPVSLAMNLFLIRLNENIVLPDFIFRFLKSNGGKAQIKKRLKGATTKTITKDNVRNIIISYPNLNEQKKTIKKLNNLSVEAKKLEIIYQQNINDLDDLKRSILDKAFKGEL